MDAEQPERKPVVVRPKLRSEVHVVSPSKRPVVKPTAIQLPEKYADRKDPNLLTWSVFCTQVESWARQQGHYDDTNNFIMVEGVKFPEIFSHLGAKFHPEFLDEIRSLANRLHDAKVGDSFLSPQNECDVLTMSDIDQHLMEPKRVAIRARAEANLVSLVYDDGVDYDANVQRLKRQFRIIGTLSDSQKYEHVRRFFHRHNYIYRRVFGIEQNQLPKVLSSALQPTAITELLKQLWQRLTIIHQDMVTEQATKATDDARTGKHSRSDSTERSGGSNSQQPPNKKPRGSGHGHRGSGTSGGQQLHHAHQQYQQRRQYSQDLAQRREQLHVDRPTHHPRSSWFETAQD